MSTEVTITLVNHGRYPDLLDRNCATGCENRNLLPLSFHLKIPCPFGDVRVRPPVPVLCFQGVTENGGEGFDARKSADCVTTVSVLMISEVSGMACYQLRA